MGIEILFPHETFHLKKVVEAALEVEVQVDQAAL